MTFRIHGVDAAYIRAIAAAGPPLRGLAADDLVAFRIHGVSPELVRTYTRLGYRELDRKDVVAMAIHGVTPRFIEDLAALGYRNITAADLVQMRIFGVTPDFIRSVERQRGRPGPRRRAGADADHGSPPCALIGSPPVVTGRPSAETFVDLSKAGGVGSPPMYLC